VNRRLVYLSAILIAINAATAPETMGPQGAVPLMLALGVLLYLTASRRNWLAWLLLESITATVGIVTIGAIADGSITAIAGALFLTTTAAVFPLEPGRATRRTRKPSTRDRSVNGGHVTASSGHE
jgi:hypothetical protein